MQEEEIRDRARSALHGYFTKRSAPRLMLSLVILLTGLVGFGISYGLLKSGVAPMWLRYPVAVLGAYGIFLVLIRLWVELERRRFDPEDPVLKESEAVYEPKHIQKEKDSWLDVLNFSSAVDDLGGCLVGAIVGVGLLLFAAISAAPVLVAEVFIDVALTGLLYRRLKNAANEHWLGTCIRRTWLLVLGTALLLGVIGFCLDQMAPGSDSMGKAFKEIFAS